MLHHSICQLYVCTTLSFINLRSTILWAVNVLTCLRVICNMSMVKPHRVASTFCITVMDYHPCTCHTSVSVILQWHVSFLCFAVFWDVKVIILSAIFFISIQPQQVLLTLFHYFCQHYSGLYASQFVLLLAVLLMLLPMFQYHRSLYCLKDSTIHKVLSASVPPLM